MEGEGGCVVVVAVLMLWRYDLLIGGLYGGYYLKVKFLKIRII